MPAMRDEGTPFGRDTLRPTEVSPVRRIDGAEQLNNEAIAGGNFRIKRVLG
jgi:hypothetical protein